MKIRIGIVIIAAMACISACQTATSAPTVTLSPSSTPLPPTATFSPVPTKTPKPPTATATPTIEPPGMLSKYLNDVSIVNLYSFDNLPKNVTVASARTKIENGTLKINGLEWQGGLDSISTFSEGQGIMFDFIIPQETKSFEFETYFDKGSWWTDTYRRFGIYLNPTPQADLWIGKNGFGNYLSGNLAIKPGTQYKVFLALGKDGDFLSVIWDSNNPELNRYFHQPMGEKWAGLVWHFAINGAKGDLIVDNMMEFKFVNIK